MGPKIRKCVLKQWVPSSVNTDIEKLRCTFPAASEDRPCIADTVHSKSSVIQWNRSSNANGGPEKKSVITFLTKTRTVNIKI